MGDVPRRLRVRLIELLFFEKSLINTYTHAHISVPIAEYLLIVSVPVYIPF